MIRVAINGFGRIGRVFLRIALNQTDIDIVAINDIATPDNLAYLLKYDSVHPTAKEKIEFENMQNNKSLDFLYPELNDPNFNIKIAKRKEFAAINFDISS